MKSTLTWEEFTRAWFELSTPKQPEPGIQKLFAHLQKGSVAKITEYKHRLLQMQKLAIPLSSNPLPDPISVKAIELFTEMQDAISKRESELEEDMAKRHKEVEDELAALRDKNTAADKQISQLAEQLSQATTETEDANKQNHKLALELSEANGEFNKVKAINTQLSKGSAELKAEFAKRLAAEQTHTLDAKKQLTKVQDEKAAAQENHIKQVDELKLLHSEVLHDVKDEITKLNVFYDQQLKERESQIKALEHQSKQDIENLSKVVSDLNDRNGQNKTLEIQLVTATEQSDRLQFKMETLNSSITVAANDIAELKAEKKELLSIMSNIKKTGKGKHLNG